MSHSPYHIPIGGLPAQSALVTDRAIFTDAYALIPAGTNRDIVTSALPFWNGMRMWVLSRPMTGFSETFSYYIVELEINGGSIQPETDANAEGVLFVVGGSLSLSISDKKYVMSEGGYAFIPAGVKWTVKNTSGDKTFFHWVRKAFVADKGLALPEAFVVNERDIASIYMPDTNGKWSTKRFVDPSDMRHDMHVNIVTLLPGGLISFAETHVMEHGLYVLSGKAVYRLNQDWVEVEAGDYIWLRAFCPQACYAAGDGPFRYLLYKDVNRHTEFL